MTPTGRAQLVKAAGRSAGFDRVGITSASELGQSEYFTGWIARGSAGQMDFLRRQEPLKDDPRRLLPGARSVICLAINYRREDKREDAPGKAADAPPFRVGDGPERRSAAAPRSVPQPKGLGAYTAFPSVPQREGWSTRTGQDPHGHARARAATDGPHFLGKVARYARGLDYHTVLHRKLRRVIDALRAQIPEPFQALPFVDSGPLLERQLAARAGLGWIAKNTLLTHARQGSYSFLAEIVTDLNLAPDAPTTDHCGSCTRCLDACPTQALTAPYQMDASRCISYLTIEHRGPIAAALQEKMGDWVYGCDICQEVCPFNHKAPLATDADLTAHRTPADVDVRGLLGLTNSDHRRLTRDAATRRAGRAMWKRNAAIVYANLLRKSGA